MWILIVLAVIIIIIGLFMYMVSRPVNVTAKITAYYDIEKKEWIKLP